MVLGGVVLEDAAARRQGGLPRRGRRVGRSAATLKRMTTLANATLPELLVAECLASGVYAVTCAT